MTISSDQRYGAIREIFIARHSSFNGSTAIQKPSSTPVCKELFGLVARCTVSTAGGCAGLWGSDFDRSDEPVSAAG